jgi:hypothetical protein
VTAKPFVPGKILFQNVGQTIPLGKVSSAAAGVSQLKTHKGSVSSSSSSDMDGSTSAKSTTLSSNASLSSSPSSNVNTSGGPAQESTSFKKQILKHHTQIIGKEKITNF